MFLWFLSLPRLGIISNASGNLEVGEYIETIPAFPSDKNLESRGGEYIDVIKLPQSLVTLVPAFSNFKVFIVSYFQAIKILGGGDKARGLCT